MARRIARVQMLLLAGTLLLPGREASGGSEEQSETLRFAAEIAQRGDWREARYRWEQAARADAENPRILNNLAVANEVLGELDKARDLYTQALARARDDSRIKENADRAALFYRTAHHEQGGDSESATAPPDAGARSRKGRGGAVSVPVKLPLPPRLDISKNESLLVAGFLSNETDLLDTGHEIVRFLRTEFHKRTGLLVRDVTPPPAVPEQPVEDFVRNAEFWKHLGRTYDADLVISGVVNFTRRDASGFGDVDSISPVTGQKVRRTQYVEQEEFRYDVEVFFFDGKTGALLFRDRFQRSAVYRGQSNDPITAFYQMSETIASDVLAVVSRRTRDEARYIFKA